MKIITVQKLFSGKSIHELPEVSDCLDKLGVGHPIDSINWAGFPGKPVIKFNIGYSDEEIFLKFYVNENCIKAEMTLSNQKVYEDSCVEFFVAPEGDRPYYNFEFNSIGTCLLGFGSDRTGRELADPDIISKIRRLPSMGIVPFDEKRGEFFWTLIIAIPLDVFFRHEIKKLKNRSFSANYYKCGDKLSSPQYVTWNPILTENPDYHRPEYFGMIRFE